MRLSTKFSLAALSLLLALGARAQSPLIMPIPEQQFFTPGGQVCSGCFVYTYISGTTTPQQTFTDSTGLTPNTNPIVLNAAGFPQTSSGAQVGIWLSSTATYRIVLQNAAHSTLYTVDGITGAFPGSTVNPLSIFDATCNQIFVGLTNFQTGLCFPTPAANITITFPATADTLVGRQTTDTLLNKTLTSPSINIPTINSVPVPGAPATYFTIANASPSGTVLNTLTKIINATSQATQAISTDTGGIIGITVGNPGTTGNATVQAAGLLSCVFDGPTTANDYVQNSTSSNGNCHDVGSSYPQNHQVIGRVLSTNGSSGTYQIDLFPAEIQGSAFANVALSIANSISGTSANTLTKLTGAPSTAVTASSIDTGGVIGITINNAGTSGNATVQISGLANCIFDAGTTANHYVQISSTVAGDCHDAGSTYPTTGQIIGRVLSTNSGGGTYSLLLFSPEINPPTTVFAVNSAFTNRNLASNVSVSANTTTTIDTVTLAALPAACGTNGCRLRISYSYYIAGGINGACWISSPFSGRPTNASTVSNNFAICTDNMISTNTFSSGATPTVTISINNVGAATACASTASSSPCNTGDSFSVALNSNMQIEVIISN